MANINEYLVPLGIDFNPFLTGIREMKGEAQALNLIMKQSGEAITLAFKNANKVQSELLANLSKNAKIATELSTAYKGIGKEADNYSSAANDIVITQKTYNDALREGIKNSKEYLSSLDLNSEEFKILSREIEAAELALSGLDEFTAQSDGWDTYQESLGETAKILERLKAAGLENTDLFRDLSEQVIQLAQAESQLKVAAPGAAPASGPITAGNIAANPTQAPQAAQDADILASAYERVQKAAEGAKGEQSGLNEALVQFIQDGTAQLETLQEGSAEYEALSAELRAATFAFAELNDATDTSGEKFYGLFGQLSDNIRVLKELKAQGLEDTEIFKQLNAEAEALAASITAINNAGTPGAGAASPEGAPAAPAAPPIDPATIPDQESIDRLIGQYKQLSIEIKNTENAKKSFSQVLAERIAVQEEELIGLEAGTAEYSKLEKELQANQVALASLNGTGKATEQNLQRLQTTLRQNVQALQQLKIAGLEDTEVYKQLEETTGKLKNTISNVQQEISLLGSDTRNLDNILRSATALTGAFAVTQGAMALFGTENENVEKALLKVNAAMSILNGLQAIQAELKRKDSLMSKAAAGAQALYATVVGTSTGALKLFRIALASTGVGLIVIALASLIANFDKVKEKVLSLFPGLATLASFIGNAVQAFTDLVGITSESERQLEGFQKRITRLNEDIGYQIEQLQARGGNEQEIYRLQRQVAENELNVLRATLKQSGKLTEEQQKRFRELKQEQIKLDIENEKRLKAEREKNKFDPNTELQREIALLQAQGGKEAEIAEKRKQIIRNQMAELEKKADKNGFLIGQEAKQYKDLANQLSVIDAEETKRKKAVGEKQKQDKDKSNKEKLESDREYARKSLELDKQYRDLKIAQMEDDAAKERAIEQARFEDAVKTVQDQLNGFKGTDDQRLALTKKINGVVEQLTLQHFTKLGEIERKYYEGRIQVIKDANKLADDVLLTDLENQKKAIRDKYAAAKRELGVQALVDPKAAAALARIRQAEAKEIQDAEDKAAKDSFDQRDELRKKEEKEVKGFWERLRNEAKKGLKSLGISEEDAEFIIKTFVGTYQRILGDYEANISAQIEAKQRQVDALTDQIDEIQQELDREVELQKAGYASNVDGKKKELEELKKQRQKELEEEKKLQVERAKLQSLEIAQATIAQTVDLGSAAAKIFKANSGIPIVGVGLAIAAVAAMFAGFMAIKAKIKAAQDAVPKFRGGGDLDLMDILAGRPSHENKGVSMIDGRTGEKIAELEGDEKLFVVNKGSGKKHDSLLDAINRDDFSALRADDNSIQQLLKEIGGIHVEGAPDVVIKDKREADKIEIIQKESLSNLASLGELQNIRKELREWKFQQANEKKVYNYGTHVEVKEGNHTKIIYPNPNVKPA